MAFPFGPLRYLYVGSKDVGRDVGFFVAGGAKRLWQVKSDEAEVGAVAVGPGPTLLFADHRKPGSVLPIYETPDLAALQRTLEKADWTLIDPGFETPEGPARVLHDPSGNEWCVMQVTRPGAMAGQETLRQ